MDHRDPIHRNTFIYTEVYMRSERDSRAAGGRASGFGGPVWVQCSSPGRPTSGTPESPRGPAMLQPLRYVLWVVAKLFLSLRYRVRVHGLDKLRGCTGPMLILPNHPG